MSKNKNYAVIRPVCCGKKRKSSQCDYYDGYDGGGFKCTDKYGCKKKKLKRLKCRNYE